MIAILSRLSGMALHGEYAVRRSMCVMTVLLSLAGCGNASPSGAAAPSATSATKATASPTPSPAITKPSKDQIAKVVASGIVAKDVAPDWKVSLDIPGVKAPSLICGKPVVPSDLVVDDLHQRQWGDRYESFGQTIYYFSSGFEATDKLYSSALRTAVACNSYTDDVKFTVIPGPTVDALAGVKDPIVLCSSGKPRGHTEYRCTAVLVEGRLVMVAYLWTDTKARVEEIFPWWVTEVETKLSWASQA
jgi:hypothetical protein